ncbi:MAG: response regulator [Comamonadaceae bacterium]|nr:MAG: response regulator [Comamonadaceae bacterium]
MPQSKAPATASERSTILVVDDNAAARYSIVRILQGAGYDTVESSGGAEALELARSTSAVVLDVHLPDLHGFEVCRLLREDPDTATLPVIHVSGVYVGPEDRVAGMSMGADAYMLSPVDPTVLVATVQTLLRARADHTSLRSSEARMRGIFGQAPIAIALVDAAGFLVEANAAFADLLEQPADALVGRLLTEFAPRAQRAEVEARLAEWRNGPWNGRFALAGASGAVRDLNWNVAPHVERGFQVAVATPA